MNGVTDTEDFDKIPLKTLAARWLFSQGVSTLLLFAILVGMYKMADYAMNTAIPEHLKQIQAGYEKIEAGHAKEVESLRSTFDKERERAERHRAADLPNPDDGTTLVRRKPPQVADEPVAQ